MTLAVSALAVWSLMASAAPDGRDIVRAAHARYAGKWFTTMTFVQKTTYPTRTTNAPGGLVQTWYETMQVPSMLRIDVAPTTGGNGMIFRNDTLYQFSGGAIRGSRPMKHSMLILLHDIHVLPAETTIANLAGLGFDLTKTHETTWEGVPVIVVGALAGDTTSKQFWFEKERLLLVRLIEPNAGGGMDAHFSGYTKHGEAWVERVIKIHQGGRLNQLEEYEDVRTNVPLEKGIFDPSRLAPPAWVGRGEERWPPAPPRN
ncbi:MAG: hypothetical protein SFU57_00140 [Gemmatimonadales bacterium]|nr:hypothetical protein [Gemmatimonadales bacterium]